MENMTAAHIEERIRSAFPEGTIERALVTPPATHIGFRVIR